MMTAAINSWTRNWMIVSADLDLAHVMLPLSSFRLEATPDNTSPVFRVLHNNQAPALDCFAESRLVPADGSQPTFSDITGKKQLPLYTLATVGDYIDVQDQMGQYLMEHSDVQHLEGKIKIPCHSQDGKRARGTKDWHSPAAIEIDVKLYQFSGAVEGGRPLLVVRAPLSPRCPMNGDGTVVGYSN
jgi:hypothetical protein